MYCITEAELSYGKRIIYTLVWDPTLSCVRNAQPSQQPSHPQHHASLSSPDGTGATHGEQISVLWNLQAGAHTIITT